MNTPAEIILRLLKKNDMTQTKLAEYMGEDVRNLNQQLTRGKDIKFQRFCEIMEYMGYVVEIKRDPTEIRRLSEEYIRNIHKKTVPNGLFWAKIGGRYFGIANLNGIPKSADFETKKECCKWLFEQRIAFWKSCGKAENIQ